MRPSIIPPLVTISMAYTARRDAEADWSINVLMFNLN
jgi:hypothetical protein